MDLTARWGPSCWQRPARPRKDLRRFSVRPDSQRSAWVDFNSRFEARFNEKPEQFASLAYDAMNALLDSICKAGLNRARIHDALADIETYDGVTGHMVFDPNQKNVAPMYLGDGAQRRALHIAVGRTMERSKAAARALAEVPYARVGEDGVELRGAASCRRAVGSGAGDALRAAERQAIAQSAEVLAALAARAAGARGHCCRSRASRTGVRLQRQLVHALMDQHALAIVALDRDASHLAEQLALKSFVPVVALSDDKVLTSINVPWIFRLPAGTSTAAALKLVRRQPNRWGRTRRKYETCLLPGRAFPGGAS